MCVKSWILHTSLASSTDTRVLRILHSHLNNCIIVHPLAEGLKVWSGDPWGPPETRSGVGRAKTTFIMRLRCDFPVDSVLSRESNGTVRRPQDG